MKLINDVLYFVSDATASRVRDEMISAGGQPGRGARSRDWLIVAAASRTCRFRLAHQVEEALTQLREHYYNFVVVDTRGAPSDESAAAQLLEKIRFAADPDLRFPLSRVIAILDPDHRLAERSFALGRQRIGGFVVEPFAGSLIAKFEQLYDPDPGKAAICLAGGGVEGLLFEVGVLKAINAHLQTRSVCDFDIYCGISAGAIVSAFLANRAEPEQIETAFTEASASGDIQKVTPAVLYDPHFREYAARVFGLARELPTASLSEIFSTLVKTVPVGFFRGNTLQGFIAKQLSSGGRSDDFRSLERELYIGATDQDTSTHVVFGDGQWRDVPISAAIRASIALTPFFEPTKIRGRYFVDGQYTRHSNFDLAIERGAKLVIIIDPLVPVRVDLPGYVRKKGGVFAGLQALKSVVHTRFLYGFQSALENHPNVDFVLFTPEGHDTRLMGGSPMKYNIRTEILNMSFRYGVRRIQRDFELLHATFAKHGFELQRHPRLRTGHRQVF